MQPEHKQRMNRSTPQSISWIAFTCIAAFLLAIALLAPLAVSAATDTDSQEATTPVFRSAPAAPMQQASTITPTLTVTKTTNGVYAAVPPGPILAVGSAVTWTYLISNTGSVSVTIEAVVDDPQGSLLDGDCTPNIGATVAPGEGMVCTVAIEDAAAGQYSNTVTVTGTNFLNPSLSTVVTDVSHYFGGSIGISLTKYTNGQDVASPTGLYLRAGDPVTWTYRITNTSNVTLTLALTDVGTSGAPGAITCAPIALTGELAPFTNTLCTMAGTVQAGAFTNTATITGTSTISSSWQTTATDTSYYFGVTTGISLTKYTNGQVVASPTGLYLRVGAPVTWTYRITNTSNVTLTLALTDVSASGVRGVGNCAPGGLAPNANALCTLTGTVQADAYTNTATVTGTTTVGAGWQITMAASSYYFGVNPQLTLSKSTNGESPTQPPGPYIPISSTVTWNYTVQNTGNVTLTALTLVDDKEGVVSTCAPHALASGLAPTQFTVCTKIGEAAAGQYTNTAVVSGTATLGAFAPVTATARSFYFGPLAQVLLTKYTNGQDVASPTGLYLRVGDPVTWTYRITNTSNVTLTLALTDVGTSGVPGAITCVPTPLTGELAPYTNTLCTMAGTVQAGAYANTATITGTSTISSSLQATATDTSYYFGVTTGISLTKYTNGQAVATPTDLYLRVGDPVTWTYRITNTSNVTLALGLTDVSASGASGVSGCAAGGLAPNANTLCTLTGTVQEIQYSNTATVTGTTTVGAGWQITMADTSHYFGIRPQVAISKTTNSEAPTQAPGPYVTPGSAVSWLYTVRNTGNVTLTELTLIDDQEGALDCTPPLVSGLAPGAQTICNKANLARAGQYTNTAVITGTDALGGFTPITASVKSFYFGVTANISLTKYTNGQAVASPTSLYLRVGDPVTWTYRITNTSNAPLSSLALSDDRQGAVVSCTPALSSGLAAGASAECTASGVVQAGQYANTATVTGATTLGTLRNVTATAGSYYFGVTPGLSLTKYTNGVVATAAPGPYLVVGDSVVWSYRITNTGNAALTGLSLTDNRVGAVTNCTPALSGGLAAGASAECTASGIVQAGQYANLAAVAGTTASGVPQTANASSYYFGVRPGIALSKVTNDVAAPVAPGPYLPEGAPVVWSYHITNTSNVSLGSLALTDDRQGAITNCTPALADGLAPDASTICTASGVAQAGQYANTATVTGATALGTPRPVTATASSHYFGVRPGIALSKYTNGELALTPPGPYLAVGAGVTWSYRITNTSNAPLGSLTLSDDQQGAITSCTPPLADGLAPEASAICTASDVVQAGQYANTATVTGATTLGTPQNVQATAVSHYFGVSSDAAVSKQVAPASADAGEVVTYTLVVTGPAAAQPVTLAITDTLPAALQGEADSVVATLGTATLDPATNTLHWSYTTTVGRADTATITYRARLTTQCTTALTNRARLFVAGVEAGQAAATLTLRSALKCDLYLPAVLKPAPIEQLPALVNGAFDASPESTGWMQLVNNAAGDLIYADGAPFAALSRPNYAWLGGARNQTNQLRQSLAAALPANYAATLQFCYRLESAETATGNDYVEIRAGEKTAPDAADSRQRIDLYTGMVTPGTQWRRAAVSLDALKGKAITIEFFSSLNGALNSNFLVDNVKLCVPAAVPGSNAPVCATEVFCVATTMMTNEGEAHGAESDSGGIEKATSNPLPVDDRAVPPDVDPGMDDAKPYATATPLPTPFPPAIETPALETSGTVEQ